MSGDDRPARLFGDAVLLNRKGARMCAAALEAVRRRAGRNGGGSPSSDFEWLETVLRLATAEPVTSEDDTEGSEVGTVSVPIRIIMPSSAPGSTRQRLTTRDAAELAGVSDRTIRKAIGSDQLAADRPGWAWLVDEHEVRRWMGERTRKRRRGTG